ncbi:Hypothetical predicted protein [Olea europaea subsp. europaea]|uniref:Uncharacterized protein n=1 Tax=Olea europaea subsp. europaea TaxID=158383 RepID=A0A8S0STE9_OLEEU|nr:Hypothetical predicted protein [Olea europaea subsp. europaea]
MEDSSSVDVILEFLKKNKFMKAEAALRSEICNRTDLNGVLRKLMLEDKELSSKLGEEVNGGKVVEEDRKITNSWCSGTGIEETTSSRSNKEVSKELIVKEIKCGIGRNGPESKWKSCGSMEERRKVNEITGLSGKHLTFSKASDDTMPDLCSLKHCPSNGPVPYQNDGRSIAGNNFSVLQVSEKSRLNTTSAFDSGMGDSKLGEDHSLSDENRTSWPGSNSKANVQTKHERSEKNELKEVDRERNTGNAGSTDDPVDHSWSRIDVSVHPTSEMWKDRPVKTFFPFYNEDASTSYDNSIGIGDKKEGEMKTDLKDVRAAIKEQVDEVERFLYFGKTQAGKSKDFSALGFQLASENKKEELPRLPPVKLKSEDKSINIHWEEKFERDWPGPKIMNADNAYLIGSFLDVPIGQEINPSVMKRPAGGSWLSVSQGITEDNSDLVSGFATIGDGLSESVDYPNEYWDSDEYEDDDDVGYMRQPIEDETWFLAHEIDYPSDNEKGTANGSIPDHQKREQNKDDEDDPSILEEDSYLSGKRYFQSKKVNPVLPSDEPIGLSVAEMYMRNDGNYNGQLMDEEELNLMTSEPVWQGFVTQTNELIILGDGKVLNEFGRPHLDDNCMDDDQHGSVRSIGLGISSNAAEMGSEVRESLVGGSSEGDLEYFHDHDGGYGVSRHSQYDLDKNYSARSKEEKFRSSIHNSDKYIMNNDIGTCKQAKNQMDVGFLFPPPRSRQLAQTSSDKSLWSNKGNVVVSDEADDYVVDNDSMLASWRHKNSDSSPANCSRDEDNANTGGSANSSPKSLSNYGYVERGHLKEEGYLITASTRDDPGASLEDEEATAVQEQVKQIKAQEEEFETFDLKIVHRKNRHSFSFIFYFFYINIIMNDSCY